MDQKKTGSSDVLMMLASKKLRVALTTTHLPLKEVYKEIRKSKVLKKIMILDSSLKSQLKIKKPTSRFWGLIRMRVKVVIWVLRKLNIFNQQSRKQRKKVLT